MIPINKPLIGEEEIEAVIKVLRSGILTSRIESASMVGQLERAFAEFVKAKYAFAVNSGTSALQLSLLANGVKLGDEVIVPSFTFVSTAETAVLVGAKPVFVDIDPDTYNIDPAEVRKAMTKKTKAIIPVDLFGLPADMKPIRELASERDVVIVEDAAQAHGAEYAGKPVGSFAELSCWSFYASKNMTTGEGGMITTNHDEYREKLPFMRSHGEREEYVSSMIGGNFRMPEMEAAIGTAQLMKLPGFLRQRRVNARNLTTALQEVSQLQLPSSPAGYKHSWYLYTVRLKNADEKQRNDVVGKLRRSGVGAAVYYRSPIHLMPFYREFAKGHLPNTEAAASQVLSLPVHPAVTPEDMEHIVASTKRLLS